MRPSTTTRDKVRRLSRCLPHLTVEELAVLVHRQPSTVRRHLAGLRCRRTVAPFARAPGGDHPEWQATHAGDRTARPVVLSVLSRAADHRVRLSAAGNPRTPAAALRRLALDRSASVRQAAVRNPSCPPDRHTSASRDPDIVVRTTLIAAVSGSASLATMCRLAVLGGLPTLQLLAERADCPVPVLTKLSTHPHWIVRAAVAKNPNCATAILSVLSSDTAYRVQHAVAQHPRCPPTALLPLANNDARAIRQAVASNPNCPSRLLEMLHNDREHTVRLAAAEALDRQASSEGSPAC